LGKIVTLWENSTSSELSLIGISIELQLIGWCCSKWKITRKVNLNFQIFFDWIFFFKKKMSRNWTSIEIPQSTPKKSKYKIIWQMFFLGLETFLVFKVRPYSFGKIVDFRTWKTNDLLYVFKIKISYFVHLNVNVVNWFN